MPPHPPSLQFLLSSSSSQAWEANTKPHHLLSPLGPFVPHRHGPCHSVNILALQSHLLCQTSASAPEMTRRAQELTWVKCPILSHLLLNNRRIPGCTFLDKETESTRLRSERGSLQNWSPSRLHSSRRDSHHEQGWRRFRLLWFALFGYETGRTQGVTGELEQG